MTDEPINLVLNRLNRLDDKIDRLIDRATELIIHVGSLETLVEHSPEHGRTVCAYRQSQRAA
jgi:hypothetical protein